MMKTERKIYKNNGSPRQGSIRSFLFKGTASVCYWSGLTSTLNHLSSSYVMRPGVPFSLSLRKRKGACFQILTYHRVSPDPDPFAIDMVTLESFEQQMAYLAEYCSVLPLEGILDHLQGGKELPPNCVAITFDDGYRDNYTYAFPILQKYRLGATLFLATGYIGTGKTLWYDELFHQFAQTGCKEVYIGGLALSFPVVTQQERVRAVRATLSHLIRLPNPQRLREIGDLHAQLGVQPPKESRNLMLDWDQVQRMRKGGVYFGSHTVSHLILSRVLPQEARWEIFESKRHIEEQLQEPVRTFAYPNGTLGDYSPAIISLLKEAGYEAAVTTIFQTNDMGEDPYQLKRLRPWENHLPSFAAKLALYRMGWGLR